MMFKKYIFLLVFMLGVIFPAGSGDFPVQELIDEPRRVTVLPIGMNPQNNLPLSFEETTPSEGELLISAIPFLLWVYIIPFITYSK